MLVPEEYRCCICLSAPEQALLTGCPHHICTSCAAAGNLRSCPVCNAVFPADQQLDEAFASVVAGAVLSCECGASVSVLEADAHDCENLRKRRKPEDLALQFGRRKGPPAVPNRSTFKCPLCDERNLTQQDLLKHCENIHAKKARGPTPAVCPICASLPWGDPEYPSRDFLSHIQLRHGFDYAVVTDFEADEEDMMERALRDSMASAGDLIAEEERILAEVLQMSAREAGEPDPAGHSIRGTDSPDGNGGSGSDSGSPPAPGRHSARATESSEGSGGSGSVHSGRTLPAGFALQCPGRRRESPSSTSGRSPKSRGRREVASSSSSVGGSSAGGGGGSPNSRGECATASSSSHGCMPQGSAVHPSELTSPKKEGRRSRGSRRK
mmetsp:Transcript_147351/g.473489  ORF Transcript_147351/g.473489 Transcript_147351/m.473489 type:complete len:382 (+) Transcript_147351:111-1256(+)